MVHDEDRLDQLLLAVSLEEEVDDVAALVARLDLDAALLRKRSGLLLGGDGVKIHARPALDGLGHGQALKGLAEVDLGALIADRRRAADRLRQMPEEILRQVHHAVIVGVGLIELHERKLGVVACVEALVAEDAADLVDLLEAPDDQALEVQLQ